MMDMDDFPGWSNNFSLMWRQELSRHASGRVRVKDMGRPIWRAVWTSIPMRVNELDKWRGHIDALGQSRDTFDAWPKSRCWPIKHPNGTGMTGSAVVSELGSGNSSLKISGVDGLTLSIGDVIGIGGSVYRVTSATSADTLTPYETGLFSVAPYFWPGVEVNDAITLKQPSVKMVIDPGSVNTDAALNGWGTVSFTSIEARP